jgi:hypothetical protein
MIPGNGPFTMGGAIGNPRDKYRVRCTEKPTLVATELKAGPDGFCGSMSLCARCQVEFLKQFGDNYATFTLLMVY